MDFKITRINIVMVVYETILIFTRKEEIIVFFLEMKKIEKSRD